MEKQHKFSLWYVLLGVWVILIIHDVIYSFFAVKTIPYSEFLDLVKKGGVAEVAISQNRVEGRLSDKEDQQGTMFDISGVLVGSPGQHGSGPGSVKHHARPDDARAQRARRRVTCPGDNRCARRETEVFGGFWCHLTDDLPGRYDARQLVRVNAQQTDQLVRPGPGLRIPTDR